MEAYRKLCLQKIMNVFTLIHKPTNACFNIIISQTNLYDWWKVPTYQNFCPT